MQLNIIIEDNKTKDLAPPSIPQSRAKDVNGLSQREILKLERGNSLSETTQKLINLLGKIYESENSNLFFHRKSKFFFKKKSDNIESYTDLRGLAIIPAAIMVTGKIINP